MRYHGGKWRLAPWIISHFPEHKVYLEPFGGAASVLLRKDRSQLEVYNDLSGDVVNLFRVLRDPEQAQSLLRMIRLTPFARAEFELACDEPASDPVEAARRMVFRSFAGFGSFSSSRSRTGFRTGTVSRSVARDWMHYGLALAEIIERLSGVVIENMAAIQAIRKYDSTETLIYADPPYVLSTRSQSMRNVYHHEMTDAEHVELASVLHAARGMVVVSGYRCDLYDDLYRDWQRVDRRAYADGARERTESIWLNRRG